MKIVECVKEYVRVHCLGSSVAFGKECEGDVHGVVVSSRLPEDQTHLASRECVKAFYWHDGELPLLVWGLHCEWKWAYCLPKHHNQKILRETWQVYLCCSPLEFERSKEHQQDRGGVE